MTKKDIKYVFFDTTYLLLLAECGTFAPRNQVIAVILIFWHRVFGVRFTCL